MLLRKIATARRHSYLPTVRYDPDRQVTQVLEHGTWVDSWLSIQVPKTKKADMETGEDQKGT